MEIGYVQTVQGIVVEGSSPRYCNVRLGVERSSNDVESISLSFDEIQIIVPYANIEQLINDIRQFNVDFEEGEK